MTKAIAKKHLYQSQRILIILIWVFSTLHLGCDTSTGEKSGKVFDLRQDTAESVSFDRDDMGTHFLYDRLSNSLIYHFKGLRVVYFVKSKNIYLLDYSSLGERKTVTDKKYINKEIYLFEYPDFIQMCENDDLFDEHSFASLYLKLLYGDTSYSYIQDIPIDYASSCFMYLLDTEKTLVNNVNLQPDAGRLGYLSVPNCELNIREAISIHESYCQFALKFFITSSYPGDGTIGIGYIFDTPEGLRLNTLMIGDICEF